MAVNKVVDNGEVKLDMTGDTITPDKLQKGITAHDKSGTAITGTSTLDSDTSADTAAVAEILSGKTAHVKGAKLTGTMKNNGAVSGTIATAGGEYTIPQGYHNGSGKVGIASAEKDKLVPANIKDGVTILGVAGTYSGEGTIDDSITEFSQENSQAAEFVSIARQTYSENTTIFTSIVGRYAGNGKTEYQYPLGYDLSVPKDGTLLLVNEATGKGNEAVAVSAGTTTVYNLVPGDVYTYILKDSAGDVYQAGRLKSTGELRMLKVPNCWNFRDLGGWACVDGTVKYGKLLRGGELIGEESSTANPKQNVDNSTDEGKRAIRDFGILEEMDLRTPGEKDNGTSTTTDDVLSCVAGKYIGYTNQPIEGTFAAFDLSRTNYTNTVKVIRQIINNIVNDRPTYFHCVAGADRTGNISFILLALLGVSLADLEVEYELTSFYSIRGRDTLKPTIDYINTFTAQEDLFMYHAAQWAVQAGVPLSEINAFRAAMIDGSYDTAITLPTQLKITRQPRDISVVEGTAVTESIAAQGDGLTYAWQYRTSSSGTWASVTELDISATGASVTVPAQGVTPDASGWQVRCIVTDAYGNSVTSDAATLTVTDKGYNITLSLTSCASSNSSKSVSKNASYTTTLSADSGYEMNAVTVMMGGTDITSTAYNSSTGVISISQVTGDVTITAKATKIDQGVISTSVTADGETPYNGGLGYKNGYYVSGMEEHSDSTAVITGYIDYTEFENKAGTKITIKGYTGDAGASHTRMQICGLNNGSTMTVRNERNGFLSTPSSPFSVTKSGSDYVLTSTGNLHGSYGTYQKYFLRFSFASTKGETLSIKIS